MDKDCPSTADRIPGVECGCSGQSFILDRQRGMFLVRSRNDATSPMDLLAIAAVSLLLSCLTGFAWGRHQALRSGARRGDWLCLACGQRNEFELDRCWSCDRRAGTTVHDPSHIPLARRWPCADCAAWNGIARDACWRCGSTRGPNESPALLPGSRAPASRGASIPQAPRQSTEADAWKRRNS